MSLIKRQVRAKSAFEWILICTLGFALTLTGCSMKPLKDGLFKLGPNASVTSTSVWLESLDEAQKISIDTGKPILADFTGTDWCVWCQRLRDEVFDQPEFLEWASENVVLLELDYPHHGRQSAAIKAQNAELKARYGIESFPTIVLIDAAGNELGRNGYVKGGPNAWIQEVESFLSRAVQP